MPWATSSRVSRLPPDWSRLRAACRARAGGRCEAVEDGRRCARAGTECHHAGARDDHTQLRWLCADHHLTITLQEATRARAAMQARARIRTDPHPGLAPTQKPPAAL